MCLSCSFAVYWVMSLFINNSKNVGYAMNSHQGFLNCSSGFSVPSRTVPFLCHGLHCLYHLLLLVPITEVLNLFTFLSNMVVTGQPQVNIEHFKWGYCDKHGFF